jgi:hypothetical protein
MNELWRGHARILGGEKLARERMRRDVSGAQIRKIGEFSTCTPMLLTQDLCVKPEPTSSRATPLRIRSARGHWAHPSWNRRFLRLFLRHG